MSALENSVSGPDAEGYGVLAVRGPDSAKFLQGQLSADMEALAPRASTIAGFHNPQGRVVAVLAVARTSEEEFLAALPRGLVESVVQRLRKFVLRARVRIEDVSTSVRVLRMLATDHEPSVSWGHRKLLLVPQDHRLYDDPGSPAGSWNLADVAEGLPLVYAQTSELFVAQMLNLDVLGAISFAKGCYTGQEVIARAHYRGRVKRRMQRWRNSSGTALKPGDAARATDGRALTVVRVADDGSGRQELLALGNFGPVAEPTADTHEAGVVVVEGPLPLPYELPE
jgi:folate-binding protein YgfZ